MNVDGGQYSSPGVVWGSLEQYYAHRELQKAWDDLSAKMDSTRTRPPEGVALEDVKVARKLLRLE